MKLYNITMRLNRLEMLNQMVRLHIIGTGSKVENELQDHLIKGSIDEYKRQASILGLNINRTGIERRARFIVSQDYHNSHFSDRVWRDTRELSRRIERNIESVVIQGKNPRDFAKKLRDLVSKDIKNITNATERLAYTESGRVWIQTQMEAYKDGGYEYLEIMTEPTACRHCSPHNGDIVKISEAVEGDNIPLWHPRCRCTTVAYFDDKIDDKDILKDEIEKYYDSVEDEPALNNIFSQDKYYLGNLPNKINKLIPVDFNDIYVSKHDIIRIIKRHGNELAKHEFNNLFESIDKPDLITESRDKSKNRILVYKKLDNKHYSEMGIVKKTEGYVIHYMKTRNRSVRSQTRRFKTFYKSDS